MAKAKVVKEVEGRWLIAKHAGEGTLIIRSPDKNLDDLIIPPFQEVVVGEEWLNVPWFSRDVSDGKIVLTRSDSVPSVVKHEISEEWASKLNDTQRAFVMMVCSGGEFKQIYKDNIELHKLLGPGGVQRPGTAVTKPFLQTKHRFLLNALLELEKSWKNRKEVLSVAEAALKAIDLL
jgi:hypothetical protein